MDINLVVCDLYNGFTPFNNHEFMIDDVVHYDTFMYHEIEFSKECIMLY